MYTIVAPTIAPTLNSITKFYNEHEVFKSHIIVTDSIKQDQYNAKMHIFNFWIEKVIKRNHVVYLKRKKDRSKCKYFILILIHKESLHAYMYKFFSLSDADKKTPH